MNTLQNSKIHKRSTELMTNTYNNASFTMKMTDYNSIKLIEFNKESGQGSRYKDMLEWQYRAMVVVSRISSHGVGSC